MLCAVLSGMNAFLLSASRLLYAMSNVDALPAWYGNVDRRTGVPRNAILLLGLLSLIAPFFGRNIINWVVDMTSVGASLSFAYACASVIKLARKQRECFWVWIGSFGLVFSVFFLGLLLIPGAPGFLSAPSLAALGIWAVAGLILFCITRKNYYGSNKLKTLLHPRQEAHAQEENP